MLKEIAKSIYDAIQVKLEGKGYCPRFLNFCFNEDGEFVEYFFTDDIFGDDGTFKWGGIERNEYANMSVEDIEEELNYIQDKDGKIALAHKDFLERLAKQEKLPF